VCKLGSCEPAAAWAVAIDEHAVDAVASVAVGPLSGLVFAVGGAKTPSVAGCFYRQLSPFDGGTVTAKTSRGRGTCQLYDVRPWFDGRDEQSFGAGVVAGNVLIDGVALGSTDLRNGDALITFWQLNGVVSGRVAGGDGPQRTKAVIPDPLSDNLFLVGEFSQAIDFDQVIDAEGGQDVFVARIDRFINFFGVYGIGAEGDETFAAATTSVSGDVLILGKTTSPVLALGVSVPIEVGPGGFLTARTQEGSGIWGFGWGDTTTEPHGLAEREGVIAMVGAFRGSLTLAEEHTAPDGATGGYVAKVASNGTLVWSLAFSAPDAVVIARAVALDDDGNILVVGELEGAVDFGGGEIVSQGDGPNLFIASFDTNGVHRFSQRFGTGDALALAITPIDDEFIVSGEFTGSLDFGHGVLESKNGSDGFVARVHP
jgi:hypothetical protein